MPLINSLQSDRHIIIPRSIITSPVMGRPWAWLCDVLHVGSLSKRKNLSLVWTLPSPLHHPRFESTTRHTLWTEYLTDRGEKTIKRCRTVELRVGGEFTASNADSFGVAEDLKRCDNDTGERLSYTARQNPTGDNDHHHPSSSIMT